MSEFIAIKGLVVRKDNIIFVRKMNPKDIEFAIRQDTFSQLYMIEFQDETERDRAFDKIMVALTGDLE